MQKAEIMETPGSGGFGLRTVADIQVFVMLSCNRNRLWRGVHCSVVFASMRKRVISQAADLKLFSQFRSFKACPVLP